MSNENKSSEKESSYSTSWLILLSVATYIVFGGALFGIAGRVDVFWLWATLVVFVVGHLVMVFALRDDPGLIRERLKPGSGEPGWDRVVLGLSVIVILANLIFTPPDVGRFHWSDSVPVVWHVVGLLGLGISMLVAVLVIVRTALEDRFLQRELDGYKEYAAEVRWRLLPGIW